MKHCSNLLLFAILICGTTVFAQKNTLTMGLFYWPKTENSVMHGHLGYYQVLEGRHSIGAKIMISNGEIGIQEDKVNVIVGNIDLVNRWTYLEKGGRSKLILEAGLSLSGIKQKDNPYLYGYCDTGMTPESIRELERKIQRQKDIVLRTGIATAVSWEFALSPFLGIGIGTTFNVYYSPRDGWFFLPVPNLNAAYSF